MPTLTPRQAKNAQFVVSNAKGCFPKHVMYIFTPLKYLTYAQPGRH